MIVEDIQNEIIKLNQKNMEIGKTRIGKQGARYLLSDLKSFVHTLESQYPHGSKFYKYDQFNEISLTDAIESLEYYEKSKLKKKHDYYFNKGVKEYQYGIDGIISDLEEELEKLKI